MISDTGTPEGLKMTEIGLLPEEWKVTKLGNLAKKMKAGGTPSRKVQAYWNGDIPFVLIEDMTSCGLFLSRTRQTITEEGLRNSSAWIVPPNSLLLSMYASIGKTAINTIPLATNQAILAIVPEADFNIKFGAYAIRFHATRLIIRNVQSTQKNVNKGIVKDFEIPLPPFFEQIQIAFVLSTVQRAMEKTESVINATKELKKSLMKHLFMYGPVSVSEMEEVVLKETEIGSIPDDWEVVKLGGVLRRTQYGISKRAEKTGEYPILRMNNLTNGRIDISDLKYINLESKEFKKFRLRKDDILFNRTNSADLVGKTAIFDLRGEFVFASYLIRLTAHDSRVDPYYLNYYLDWDLTQSRLRMLASRGVSQSNINATRLRGFLIPLPPYSTQYRIATVLSVLDQKVEAELAKKKALEELFRTLLHDLITGKIRVTRLEVPHDQTR